MPIADMIMTAPFEDVEASLTLLRNDRCQIEIETRGQSKNMKWFQHRRGSVTASRFSDIRRFMHGARISEQRLVEEVLGTKYKTMAFPTCPNKPSLKWGLANEAKAKAKYKELMSTSHGSTTYAHPTNAHPTNAHRTNAHPTNAHMLIWKTTFAHNDYIYGERQLLATYFLLT